MQISFYVLGERYASTNGANALSTASDSEAVLNFICKLTQTVLTKSEHSLIIIDDDIDRLTKLDKQLWSFDAVSFIPHQLLNNRQVESKSSDPKVKPNSELTKQEEQILQDNTVNLDELSTPVTLLSSLPQGFDGVVLNLATAPLPLKSSTSYPERVLEIITPDEISKEQGRDKYRYYQQLNVELIYHPIK